jgi:hypothetical protein
MSSGASAEKANPSPAPGYPEASSGERPHLRFNVVILYEQRAFVGKAMSIYFHLKRELGNELDTDLRLWRVDVATLPEFMAQAEHDLEIADVIIMAVHGGTPCPPAFRQWKTGTGLGLNLARSAVIAIAEMVPEPAAVTETWSSVLRGFTTEIHEGIYVCDAPVAGTDAAAEPFAGDRVPHLAAAVGAV